MSERSVASVHRRESHGDVPCTKQDKPLHSLVMIVSPRGESTKNWENIFLLLVYQIVCTADNGCVYACCASSRDSRGKRGGRNAVGL